MWLRASGVAGTWHWHHDLLKLGGLHRMARHRTTQAAHAPLLAVTRWHHFHPMIAGVTPWLAGEAGRCLIAGRSSACTCTTGSPPRQQGDATGPTSPTCETQSAWMELRLVAAPAWDRLRTRLIASICLSVSATCWPSLRTAGALRCTQQLHGRWLFPCLFLHCVLPVCLPVQVARTALRIEVPLWTVGGVLTP